MAAREVRAQKGKEKGKTERSLTPEDLGINSAANVVGKIKIKNGKMTVKTDYIAKPKGKGGIGAKGLGAKQALMNAAKNAGAKTLRIETSPIIESSGRLGKALGRRGFQARSNGTMFWEGPVQ